VNGTSPRPESTGATDNDDANELGIRTEGLDREQLLELADKVFALLRHELIIERERHGQRGLD
jgi:hypothetical protein